MNLRVPFRDPNASTVPRRRAACQPACGQIDAPQRNLYNAGYVDITHGNGGLGLPHKVTINTAAAASAAAFSE
jgi:hypothetical protein